MRAVVLYIDTERGLWLPQVFSVILQTALAYWREFLYSYICLEAEKRMKNARFVLGFVVGIVLSACLYLTHHVPNIYFGSVGEWVGSIATAIAIYMVYWQVNKTLVSEKELDFSKSRPFFVIEQNLNYDESERCLAFFSSEAECNSKGHHRYMIKIRNISNKKMMAIKIVGESDKGEKTAYFINYIKPEHTIAIVFPWKKDEINLSKISIYFHTELRERVKLVWERAPEGETLEYKEKKLANRLKKNDDVEAFKGYDVNNFHESYFNDGRFRKRVTIKNQEKNDNKK